MFHKFLEEFHKHSWQQPLYLIPRPGATDTRPVPDSSLSRSATAPAPAGGANPSSSSSSGNNTNSILNTSNLPNGSNNVHNVGKSSSTGAAAGSAQNAANTASALATALANHPGISRASSSSSLNNNNPMEMSYSRISWSPEYEGFETDSAEEVFVLKDFSVRVSSAAFLLKMSFFLCIMKDRHCLRPYEYISRCVGLIN